MEKNPKDTLVSFQVFFNWFFNPEDVNLINHKQSYTIKGGLK